MFPFPITIPLDPLFDYLAETLPPPLYFFLIKLLSHTLALFTAFYTLIASLISSNPSEWDLQTLLPPIISILAAYLALASLYRTTRWMLRISIWFIKWGSVLGVLLAGAGWYMGHVDANGIGEYGFMNQMGDILVDAVNGRGRNPPNTKSQAQKTRSKKGGPKPWDSFDQHREWRYQENRAGHNADDVQQFAKNILDSARDILSGTSWWNMANPAERGRTQGSQRRDEERIKKSQKMKGNSRSR